ncbi:MAG: nuclear transport factor 2 family protein [Candidatus Acidiferrales bacterium]
MAPAPGTKKSHDLRPVGISAKSPFTAFRKLFECVKINDFDAMADTIADDCEWVLMSDMRKFKGKQEVVAFCQARKLACEEEPEIIFDVATSEWGVFEYLNRGTVTANLSALAAASGWKFPMDPGTHAGRQYAVRVCFVYRVNLEGKIYMLNEYLDLASLMSQFA